MGGFWGFFFRKSFRMVEWNILEEKVYIFKYFRGREWFLYVLGVVVRYFRLVFFLNCDEGLIYEIFNLVEVYVFVKVKYK